MQLRFKKLAERLGFKIKPTGCFINGTFSRRPDVMSVQYKGRHIMTIPKRILGFPSQGHRNLIGQVNPDYFELEYKLKSWNKTIKETNWLHDEQEKEKQI